MLEALITIALLHWVVLLTPGVNFVLLVQLAASGQRTAAVYAVLGITTATFVWATLAVLGVGTIFAAHPALRQVAQLVAGCYLVYVAVRLWLSNHRTERREHKVVNKSAAFRIGFMTNILNPKPALFFGSAFVTTLPAHVGIAGIVSAVMLVYINAVVWHVFLALSFSTERVTRGYERFAKPFNRTASVIVGSFGVKLLSDLLKDWHRTTQLERL